MDKAALFVYGGQFANGIFTYGGSQVEIGGLTADVWSGVYPSGGTGVPAYAIYSNGQDSLVDITGTSRSNIMGHLYSLEKGTIKVNLNTPDSVLTGLSKTKGTTSDGTTNLSLSNGALWNVAGDSTVTDLSVKSAARGNMTYNTNGQTLTAGHFSGQDGIFYMKSDLASEIHGDKVYITEAEAGSKGFIGVYDKSLATGKAVTDIRHLLMVTDESKNATFSGKDLNTGGLWTIVPTIRRGGTFEDETGNLYGDPEQWYLVTVDKVINEDTVPIITSLDAPYGLYRSLALDTLRQRLGDIRYRNRREDRYDFWVRNRNGHFEGQGFDSRYNVFQAGVDTMPDEKSVYGPLVERGIAGPSYEKGSGKNHTLAAALYGTWLGDRGDYTDVVAKIGRNDTTLHTYGPYADTASYRGNEKSLSVEYGRTVPLGDHGYFVEPEVQFVWGYIGSTSYTTRKGTHVRQDSFHSAIGRLGIILGKKQKEGDHPHDFYLKTSILHEFGEGRGGYLSRLNRYGDEEILQGQGSYKDTWFEFGFGGNVKINDRTSFYGDVERSFGGDFRKKWQFNMGLSWSF